MNEHAHDSSAHQRFFRDGAPYIDNFEVVASLLLGRNTQSDPFIESTLLLVRGVYNQLADCQATLGKVETLIEESREGNTDPEIIKELIAVCCDLQSMQLKLSEQVIQSIKQVIGDVFPN